MTLPFPQLRELGLQLENDTAIVGLSIQECIIAIASYLLVGVIAFCFVFEDWPIVDALYFSVSTFTTVGTGDVVPQSDAGRAFTCFFGLGGIGFLGLAIATLGSNLALAEKQAIEQAERASRERVIDIFEGLPLVSNTENNQEGKCVVEADSDTKAELDREPESWSRMLRGTFLKSFPAFATLCFGGLMMGALEGWQWNTSLYYSFITSATIGMCYVSKILIEPVSPFRTRKTNLLRQGSAMWHQGLPRVGLGLSYSFHWRLRLPGRFWATWPPLLSIAVK